MSRDNEELLLKVVVSKDNTLSFNVYGSREDVFSILPMYADVVRQELIEYYMDESNAGVSKPVAKAFADRELTRLLKKGLNFRKENPNRSKKIYIRSVEISE